MLDEYDGDFDRLMASIASADVEHMLCVSIDLDKYPGMLERIQGFDNVSVSVGIHPMAKQSTPCDADKLAAYASHEKVVAVGETGLDYYYHQGERDWQRERFREHIRCANAVAKPLIVHTRDAGEDTLNILQEEQASQCGGVIHCFTETMEFAEQAMDIGFMISFSGIVTFRNADKLREIAASIPDEYLLIETDSPYLAPVPHRGQQNTPAYVRHVAQVLADVRQVSVEHIAKISRQNFYRLFPSGRKDARE